MTVGYVSADIDSTTSKTLAGTGSDRLVIIADSGTSAAVRTLLTLALNGVSGVTLETVGVDGGTAIMNGLAHIVDASEPGAGTFTIADTWSGSAPANDVYASIELSGVDQTTPRETVISNSTTALADGGTIDVTVAGYSGEFALCFICTNGGGAGGGHTLPTGFTSITEVLSGTNRTHWGYINSIGSASEVYTFTASGDGSSTMQSVSAGVIVINAASSGVTGTASFTEAADTIAASGNVVISGTATITEGPDTINASGSTSGGGVAGSATITEGADTASASGTVQTVITGTAAITEAEDTVAASGNVVIIGTATITEGQDTINASGSAASPVTGAVSITEEADTITATDREHLSIIGNYEVNGVEKTIKDVGSLLDVIEAAADKAAARVAIGQFMTEHDLNPQTYVLSTLELSALELLS